jgi:hypothetical protein
MLIYEILVLKYPTRPVLPHDPAYLLQEWRKREKKSVKIRAVSDGIETASRTRKNCLLGLPLRVNRVSCA